VFSSFRSGNDKQKERETERATDKETKRETDLIVLVPEVFFLFVWECF
jgi:hypothetical protein